GVSSSCSWSPDGEKLVLVRHEEADKYGSRQADLYEYNLSVEERGLAGEIFWGLPGLLSDYERPSPRLRRLSRGLRALYPAYSPDGQWIAFVHNGGTHNNLGVMRADGTQVRYLTHFEDGTQLYTPQWSPDGQYLAFSIARQGARDLARLRVDQPEALVEVLVATAGTDRDPVWSAGGGELVFASDFTGIFNLYTYDLQTQAIRPLTEVQGGAFTPTCSPTGEVAFAAYGARGFQIRKVGGKPGAALVPPAAPAPGATPKAALLPSHPYGIDFLKTSLIPRLLVDKGRFKGGLYLSSGDVLSRQNIFAGAAFAPTNGDRDLFALYEYRGWRPTAFLEFYHQRRNSPRADTTEDQALITTGTIFNLNQFNLGLKGEAGRHGEVALSLTYDRYDASIASRYFDAQRIEWVEQKPFGYTYLQGFDLGLSYRFEALARRRDQEISPRGRQLYLRCDRIYNFFIKGFREGVTFIDEDYLHLFYNQFTLDWNEHLPLPLGAALGLRFFGGWIASGEVDDEELVNSFFDYHLGGIQYMKGYTFYSVEGRKAAMGTATLRFPILPDLRRRVLHLYFDKLYGAVYGDLGKAWDGRRGELNAEYGRRGPLRDLGAQLRCDLFSYYSMPTRVQADLAYGIDEVAGKSPWKFYLTVLFGYL
ncbi:MAG: PD40 domain-containing protein, partial [Candidatus Latescibacteria bacterium]|nr:PD40 domain-containing protein [Candidatus Latescibacterota bacterium]